MKPSQRSRPVEKRTSCLLNVIRAALSANEDETFGPAEFRRRDPAALYERGHHARVIREGWLSGVEAARVRP
jgi:hypothetical protein